MNFPPALQFLAALGCGLMAGVFFAFSSFVMTALARLAPAEGMRAMQAINVGAVRSGFVVAFLAIAGICLVVAIAGAWDLRRPGATFAIAGAAAYLIGCFLVTMAGNVPMNDALAALPADAPEAPACWAEYLQRWTAWNHVRTLACLAAAGLLTASLMARP